MTDSLTLISVAPAPVTLVAVPPPDMVVVPAGQGLQGVPGPMGPAGPAGGVTHTHVQDTPVAVWPVTHALGRYPAVVVVDSTGTVVDGDIDYLDANNVTISFAGAFAGRAFFN